jgi:uncharacterized membrane protein YvbJ
MASIGKRTTVKELERAAKQPVARKATRLKKPVHITEDEADILISMRREREKRVSLAEVLRKPATTITASDSLATITASFSASSTSSSSS